MQREPAYLLDILYSARLIQDFTQGVSKEDFESDILRQDAIMRRIEIIGEASRRLSDEFRANHPEIPWKSMAGMRSRLIHNYDDVDLNQVWDVVQQDIPALIAQISPLVPPDDSDQK
jgi:uncharacterized protein with HEPN domain